MAQGNVTEEELQKVAYIRGHFPLGTPIESFPTDYWDMIVAHWQATVEVIENQVRKEPELPLRCRFWELEIIARYNKRYL